jgi:HPt (histidine-containing phosphotransfer) domain-containing protein
MTPTSSNAPIVVFLEREMQDVIADYLQNRQHDVNEIIDALRRGDFDDVRHIGHAMAQSGQTYGLSRLARLGEALEESAKARAADAIGRHLDALRAFLRRVTVVYR